MTSSPKSSNSSVFLSTDLKQNPGSLSSIIHQFKNPLDDRLVGIMGIAEVLKMELANIDTGCPKEAANSEKSNLISLRSIEETILSPDKTLSPSQQAKAQCLTFVELLTTTAAEMNELVYELLNAINISLKENR